MRRAVGFLAAVLLLAACARGAGAPCVEVSEQTVICGSDTLVEDIRVPLVFGFNDKAFEAALGERITAFVDTARKDARQAARVAQQWVPYVCVLAVDYEIKTNCGLFSMRLTADLENGGTGMPNTAYINADIAKSAFLQLDDLFVSREYRAALDQHIAELMRADARFSPEEFTGVSNKTAFFVADGQLFIAFGKYEVASGMTGEPVFGIPPALIRGLVRPEYAGWFAR